jgi:hypothetical protein
MNIVVREELLHSSDSWFDQLRITATHHQNKQQNVVSRNNPSICFFVNEDLISDKVPSSVSIIYRNKPSFLKPDFLILSMPSIRISLYCLKKSLDSIDAYVYKLAIINDQ